MIAQAKLPRGRELQCDQEFFDEAQSNNTKNNTWSKPWNQDRGRDQVENYCEGAQQDYKKPLRASKKHIHLDTPT